MSDSTQITTDILAVCLDTVGSPIFNVNSQSSCVANSHGWGVGWYPNDEQSAMMVKEPIAKNTQALLDAIDDSTNYRSTIFICKSFLTREGYSVKDTQPFARSYAGQDWMFAHNGDLDMFELQKLHDDQSRLLEPLGCTDSELAFCNLLTYINDGTARKIADIPPEKLYARFRCFDALGTADMLFTDGSSIVCYHGKHSEKPIFYTRILPNENQYTYNSEITQIALNDPRDVNRTYVLLSSSPFQNGAWQMLEPKQMVIVKRGVITWDSTHDMLIQPEKVAAPTFFKPTAYE